VVFVPEIGQRLKVFGRIETPIHFGRAFELKKAEDADGAKYLADERNVRFQHQSALQ
jgi:hypothetical protein